MQIKEYKKWIEKKEKKRNKFTGRTKENKIITCKCHIGHIHNSRDESSWCNIVQLRQKQKEFKSFKVESYYPFVINGIKIGGHYVDFEIENHDGTIHVEEYKGFETSLWRIKHKLFKALYPNIEYRIIRKKDLF